MSPQSSPKPNSWANWSQVSGGVHSPSVAAADAVPGDRRRAVGVGNWQKGRPGSSGRFSQVGRWRRARRRAARASSGRLSHAGGAQGGRPTPGRASQFGTSSWAIGPTSAAAACSRPAVRRRHLCRRPRARRRSTSGSLRAGTAFGGGAARHSSAVGARWVVRRGRPRPEQLPSPGRRAGRLATATAWTWIPRELTASCGCELYHDPASDGNRFVTEPRAATESRGPRRWGVRSEGAAGDGAAHAPRVRRGRCPAQSRRSGAPRCRRSPGPRW